MTASSSVDLDAAAKEAKALWQKAFQFARSVAAHLGVIVVGLVGEPHLESVERALITAVSGIVAAADHIKH